MAGIFGKLFSEEQRELSALEKIADQVLKYEPEMQALSDDELRAKTDEYRKRIADGETVDDLLPEAFATAREAAYRVINEKPYKVQIMGSIAMHKGDISEMKTGEGKTLTATMCVYLNALAGQGVHVITVNEYLAGRDAAWMGEIYRFLGLTVGVNTRDLKPREKRDAYACDITYTTNSELGFDYLRDNMVTEVEDRVMRGLHMAVIDEVDSVLIDESRTPLIISGGKKQTANLYIQSDRFVKTLIAPEYETDKFTHEKTLISGDYDIDEKTRQIMLSEDGVHKAEKFFKIKNLYDIEHTQLVHHINQALKANYIMMREVEYVVSDEKEIVIVDQFTGRMMPGRAYSDGLHQAIEAKEGVPIKEETSTLATITYQNFFRLYEKLAGMTGTAKTEEEEFLSTYNMKVVVIPTNRPVARKDLPDEIYAHKKDKYAALVREVKRLYETGQPVLVGTIAVETSEVISQLLNKEHIPHEVLNAKNHAREAEIIAKAGRPKSVTIATNMAGRGTDIKLTEESRKLGGLAVLGSERHESRRIDNQLRGRSGRQGDPGYSKFFVSADDDLMRRFGNADMWKKNMMRLGGNQAVESPILTRTITSAQKKVEGMNFDTRKTLLDYDDVLRKQREIMYKERDFILFSDSVSSLLPDYFKRTGAAIIKESLKDENDPVVDSKKLLKNLEPEYLPTGTFKNIEEFEGMVEEDAADTLTEILKQAYENKKKDWNEEETNYVEKTIILQQVDRSWTRHIDKMSKLREAIYLRSYANTNPLQAYTNEGYDMFEKMRTTISIDSIKMLLKVQIRRRTPEEIEQIRKAQEEARMKAEAEKLAAQKVAEEAKRLEESRRVSSPDLARSIFENARQENLSSWGMPQVTPSLPTSAINDAKAPENNPSLPKENKEESK